MKDSRQPYDIDMLDGSASCARLGRALLVCGAQLLDSANLGKIGKAHTRYLVRVKVAPDQAARFAEIAGAQLVAPPVPQLD